MPNLVDIGDVPALDVWGDTVTARVIAGANASLALVELAPDAIVPEHRHEHEQLGMCITGSITFTVDGETRTLGPGGTWRIPSNRPHDAVAGPEGAVVVDIFSPVRADWDALPRSAPAGPRWPPAAR
jgi:quercetin dioxygenase-like cupin family protein